MNVKGKKVILIDEVSEFLSSMDEMNQKSENEDNYNYEKEMNEYETLLLHRTKILSIFEGCKN